MASSDSVATAAVTGLSAGWQNTLVQGASSRVNTYGPYAPLTARDAGGDERQE